MTRKKKTDALDENSALFIRLKKMVKEGEEKRAPWRKEARRAFDFIANRQWSDEDLALLAAQNRPAVSFNRCAPIVQAVCGLEINNRQQIAYLPRDEGDVAIDETITNVVKYLRDTCSAEDEDSEAFRDAVIAGEGWNETRMSYDEDPKGKVIQERIDPLEMGVNRSASKASYEDARAVYRVRDIDPDEARALVGEEFTDEALNAGWIQGMRAEPEDGGEGNKRDYPDETRVGVDGAGAKRKFVRLVQLQWYDLEDRVLVAQKGQDEMQSLTKDEFKKFSERVAMMQQADAVAIEAYNAAAEESLATELPFDLPPPTPTAIEYDSFETKQRVYYEAFLGHGVLAKRKLDMPSFQFKAITGFRDNRDKCFYGLLRDMFDPQQWANKWLSQSMNILNSNAKGGIMAETDAFVDQRKAEMEWSDPTKIIWAKPGALSKNKIKDRNPPQLPQGLNDLMMFAISSIRDVTGVNLELLGQADREQAASLEAQRRQSAMTILASLFNSLRRYRKNQGRLLLYFVWMLPDGVLYRVTEQGQHKYVRFIKDKDVDKYDVIIDETPSAPDQKHMVWGITSQILQQGIQFPPQVLVKLLKYSPYPESVVREITEAFGLGSDMPPEMLKQKLQQAEQALQVLEGQLKEAMAKANTEQEKLALERASVEVEEYRAETERMKVEFESENNERERQLEGARVAIDAQDKESDRQLEGARTAVEMQSAREEGERQQMTEDNEGRIAGVEAKLDQLIDLIKERFTAQEGA